MSHLIQKHQQTNKGTGVLRRRYLTPEQEEQFRKQYRSYTTQSSDNTSVTDTKKQITKANTPDRIQKRRQTIQTRDFKKNQEEAEKIYKTAQQYRQAQQEAATDARWNPRAQASDISKVPLFGLPATIAKATYAGMNWLTGNQGKAKYWWEDANRDAVGQTIALGAIPAHTNPYTAALYDGVLLGSYMRDLDQQGKFQYKDRLTDEDLTIMAMSMFPYIKPQVKIATQAQKRAAITAEQLNNRKYFPVEIYGKEPIYTRKTFPKIIVREAEDIENPTITDDITYMNENFGEHTMDTRQVAANRLKLWRESPHGRAINFGSDLDLSTDSWWDTFRFNMNRHLDGTGTAYIPDNFGQTEMFLNKAGHRPISQETVDFFNAGIDKYNARTGLNIPHARFVPETTKHLPAGRTLNIPARIYTPNLGLMKHKNGGII